MAEHRWSRGAGGELCEVCGVRRALGPESLEWRNGTVHTLTLCAYYSRPHGAVLWADPCPPCEKRTEGAPS